MSSDPRQLATVELLGVLTYGQLRAFEIASRAVRLAPDIRAADQVADYAVAEHANYERLRTRLKELTDLAGPVLDRQRAPMDAYFDAVPLDDWLGACTFFAVGLPVAADFANAIAPMLDGATGAVIVGALGEREEFERYAREQVAAAIASEPEIEPTVRHHVADILGAALTQFQGAVGQTDALAVLLDGASDRDEDDAVRRLAVGVLEGHRRRMHALGLEDLD